MGNYLSTTTAMDGGSGSPIPQKPPVKFNPDDIYYDMTGEKLVVVFNHYEYQATRFYHGKAPSPRTGTHEDVTTIKDVFGKLGFKTIVHNDKDYDTIDKILKEMRGTDYSHLSCLCIIILTHGFKYDGICASDRAYNLKDVTGIFENHPTLAGKPKLFFVQACRGKKMDAGTTVAYDGEGDQKTMVIPSHSDFLVMRSTKEEYRSYRDCRGSWMIQELCAVISEAHEELDLLQIITFTNKRVGYGYSTNTTDNEETHGKKVVPETTFTLTKLLKF